MPTRQPPLPLPQWRRLSDGWHVELVRGASRTACNREFRPPATEASDKAMPTHCEACRLHYRQAVKKHRQAPAAPTRAPAVKRADLGAQHGAAPPQARLSLLLVGGPLPPCPEDDPSDGERLALAILTFTGDGAAHLAEAQLRHDPDSGAPYWAMDDGSDAAELATAWIWLRGPNAQVVAP